MRTYNWYLLDNIFADWESNKFLFSLGKSFCFQVLFIWKKKKKKKKIRPSRILARTFYNNYMFEHRNLCLIKTACLSYSKCWQFNFYLKKTTTTKKTNKQIKRNKKQTKQNKKQNKTKQEQNKKTNKSITPKQLLKKKKLFFLHT